MALTASASIAKGEDFAIVIKYSSGTSVTTGDLAAGTILSLAVPYRGGLTLKYRCSLR